LEFGIERAQRSTPASPARPTPVAPRDKSSSISKEFGFEH
jgi:hypothetical protein